MHRYLAVTSAAFLAVLAAALLLGETWALCIVPLSFLALFMQKNPHILLRCLICGAVLGLLLTGICADRWKQAAALSGKTASISGYVLQTGGASGGKLTVLAELDGKRRVFVLSDYRRDADALSPGEWFTGTASFSEAVKESDTLYLSGGTAVGGELISLGETAPEPQPGPLIRAIRLRQKILWSLAIHQSSENESLALGMFTADLSQVSPGLRSQFSAAGIAHILAVSGLHLSILTAMVLRLCDIALCSRRMRSLACLGCCLGMAILAGFSVSVLRAALMTGFGLLGTVFGRQSDGLTSLGTAASLLALCNPAVVSDLSYWLTCTATLGILLFSRPIGSLLNGKRHHCRFVRILTETAAVSLAAQIGTLPVTALTFGYLPAYSLLTNLLILPLIYLVLGLDLLTLGALALGLSPVLPMAAAGVSAGWIGGIAGGIAGLPGAVLPFAFWWQILPIAVMLCGLWALCRAGTRRRRIVIALCGCIIAAGLAAYSLWAENRTIITVEHRTGSVLLQKGGRAVLLENTANGYEASLLTRLWMQSGSPEIAALLHPSASQNLTQELRLCRALSPHAFIGDSASFALGAEQLSNPVQILSDDDTYCNIIDNITISNDISGAALLTDGSQKVLKCWSGYDIITAADIPKDVLAVIDRAGNLWFREPPLYHCDWRNTTVILLR